MSQSKNLHIMQDNKFFGRMIEEIHKRGLEENNTLAVKLYKNNKELIYINRYTKRYNNLIIIDKKYNLNKLAKEYNKIIFHNLFLNDLFKLAKFKKRQQKIIWRQWTGDTSLLIKTATKKTINKYSIQTKTAKKLCPNNFLARPCKIIIGVFSVIRNKYRYTRFAKALKKIDCVGNWNEYETTEIKKHYPLNAKFYYFSYGSTQRTPELAPVFKDKSGFSIMLGHSGSPRNNHQEIIDLISEKLPHIVNLKVYTPLSYGYNDYINNLIFYGRQKLGEKYIPITDFMPANEYFKLLESFDVFVFNQIKGTGAGNVHRVISMGKKVFLREENPMWSHLLSRGVMVYSVNKLHNQPEILLEPISYQNRLNNHAIMVNSKREEKLENTMNMFLA